MILQNSDDLDKFIFVYITLEEDEGCHLLCKLIMTDNTHGGRKLEREDQELEIMIYTGIYITNPSPETA